MILIAILYLNVDCLKLLMRLSLGWGSWGRLARAMVLPYATWFLLLAMLILVRAARLGGASGNVAGDSSAGHSSPGTSCFNLVIHELCGLLPSSGVHFGSSAAVERSDGVPRNQ
jgi:hypothetical protein